MLRGSSRYSVLCYPSQLPSNPRQGDSHTNPASWKTRQRLMLCNANPLNLASALVPSPFFPAVYCQYPYGIRARLSKRKKVKMKVVSAQARQLAVTIGGRMINVVRLKLSHTTIEILSNLPWRITELNRHNSVKVNIDALQNQ